MHLSKMEPSGTTTTKALITQVIDPSYDRREEHPSTDNLTIHHHLAL